LFFGASVTAQKGDSGYVHVFSKLLVQNNFIDVNIIQKGFGSMHLCDAGICKIDEVIKENPNFCFIDWFSTGFVTNDKEYLQRLLNVIVRKLMLINCKVCFLLIDRLDLGEDRLKMFKNIIEYANQYNIQYIELYGNENVQELLRDSVHTNETGATFYAKKIYDYFMVDILHNEQIYNLIPNDNEYSNIKCMEINKQINDEIYITGNFKIIGIEQKIGPFSGLVEITRNNIEKYNQQLWDQWCHFERINIKLNTPFSESIKIKILQDSFDTTQCKCDIKFNEIKKYMYVHNIYYIGSLSNLNN
jgi:hypothetical protein